MGIGRGDHRQMAKKKVAFPSGTAKRQMAKGKRSSSVPESFFCIKHAIIASESEVQYLRLCLLPNADPLIIKKVNSNSALLLAILELDRYHVWFLYINKLGLGCERKGDEIIQNE